MKYTSTAEENTTWILLSSLWTLGGVCTWIFAFNSQPIWLDGSHISVLALVVVAIGVSLRLPILSNLPRTSPRVDHVALLLGYAATANWLGYLLLRSSHLQDAVPALLIVGFSELWLSAQCYTFSQWPWSPSGDQLAPNSLSDSANSLSDSAISLSDSANFVGELQEVAEDLQGLNEHVLRVATDGTDEQGRRFCSGKLRVNFDLGQASEEVVVGFCPAFAGDPDVDFEVDCESANGESANGESANGESANGDQISVRLVHSTPSGMRLALRRSAVHQRQSVVLHWYAVAVTEAERKPQRVLP